jgi:hypothetical protein
MISSSQKKTKQNIEDVEISVFQEVGGSAAVSSADGEGIFKRISKAIDKGVKVRLSFANVELITSTFLNAAIGQLYGKYEPEVIRQYLTVTKMEKDDLQMLKKVVDRAKLYFAEKERMQKAITRSLNG